LRCVVCSIESCLVFPSLERTVSRVLLAAATRRQEDLFVLRFF